MIRNVTMESVLSLLFLHLLCISSLPLEPVVRISQGKLSGFVEKTREGKSFSAFLGIPYAQPPIGKLRFRNPLPASNWNRTRRADTFGNVCVQKLISTDTIEGNEDCLFLNVYTPVLNFNSLKRSRRRNKLLPVMVWIHGGGFVEGYSNFYGPEYILDRDVLLVTMNYRLGIFGFFSTGDSVVPGNAGLKDQVLALKWVQQNIKSFGGDPNQVTLFGQSAGGASVSLHALSNASNGLFHRYIVQSGSPLAPWAYQRRRNLRLYAINVASKLQCPFDNSQNMINCLQGKSVQRLLNANSEFNPISQILPLMWTPTNEYENDEAFLTDSPKNLIEKKQMKDLPFMSGTTSDEGLLITESLYSNPLLNIYMRNCLKEFLNSIASSFLDLNQKVDFAAAVVRFYFNDSLNSMKEKEFISTLTELFSDGSFIYPQVRLLEKLTPIMKSSNYFYSFCYTDNPVNNGVAHSDEVAYLFRLQPVNVIVSELMVDLWTSFAINGKPTSERLSKSDLWQPYNLEHNTFLQIGNINDKTNPEITLSGSLHTRRMDFWRKYIDI